MPTAWFVAPLLVALTMLVSGATKVGKTDQTQAAMRDLKLPTVIASRGTASALPWGEITLGLALLVTPAPFFVVPAAVTGVLVAAYLAVIARAVSRDEPTECACFGSLTTGPLTRVSVFRNLALLMMSAVGVVGALSGRSVVGYLAGLDADGWSWLVAIVATGALVAAIVWNPVVELDYERTPIPEAYLLQPNGLLISLSGLAAAYPRVLIFFSPGCEPCLEIAREVPTWQASIPRIAFHAVLPIRNPVIDEQFGHLADTFLFADEQDSAAREFGIQATPAAVVLGADGYLAGGPVVGASAIQSLVGEVKSALSDAS